MRSHDPKVAVLRRLPFLHDCSDKQIAELASFVDECQVAAGHVLAREGDLGREAFVVVEGWAAVIRDGLAIAAIGPGEFIGEMAMVTRRRRSATVIAKTPMRLLVVGPAAFQTIAQHPRVGQQMVAVTAERARENEGV